MIQYSFYMVRNNHKALNILQMIVGKKFPMDILPFCTSCEWSTNYLGSRLHFKDFLYSKHHWEIEIVSFFRTEGRHICPLQGNQDLEVQSSSIGILLDVKLSPSPLSTTLRKMEFEEPAQENVTTLAIAFAGSNQVLYLWSWMSWIWDSIHENMAN